jgi:hypothetical protein
MKAVSHRDHEALLVLMGDDERELVAAYRSGRESVLDNIEMQTDDEDLQAISQPVPFPCVAIACRQPARIYDPTHLFALSQWLWTAAVALEVEIAALREESDD